MKCLKRGVITLLLVLLFSVQATAWNISDLWSDDEPYEAEMTFIYPQCAGQYMGIEPNNPINFSGPALLRMAYGNSAYLSCHRNLRDYHTLSAHFSNLIYSVIPTKRLSGDNPLSNRIGESKADAKLTLAVKEEFEGYFPEDYKIETVYKRCKSGFRAAKIVPKDSASDQCIFTIAGTNELMDAAVDKGMGKGQIYGETQTSFTEDIVNCAKAGKRTMVTGHSLGGLLAQFFAYRAQESLIKEGLTNRIEVITWNAPGGVDLVESDNKNGLFDEDLKPLEDTSRVYREMDQTHYNLSGDVVSTHGVHYGQTIELDKGFSIQVVSKHRISKVIEILEEDPKMLNGFIERAEDYNWLRGRIERRSDKIAQSNAQETERRAKIRQSIEALKTNNDNPMCRAIPEAVIDVEINSESERRPEYKEG